MNSTGHTAQCYLWKSTQSFPWGLFKNANLKWNKGNTASICSLKGNHNWGRLIFFPFKEGKEQIPSPHNFSPWWDKPKRTRREENVLLLWNLISKSERMSVCCTCDRELIIFHGVFYQKHVHKYDTNRKSQRPLTTRWWSCGLAALASDIIHLFRGKKFEK